MFAWLRSTVRHPLYPGLPATPAVEASGQHAALAGNFEELKEAFGRGATVLRAVFLLHDCDAALPDLRQRDLLWQWFSVPAYVLVLDARGRPAAYECEAQDGLHVSADWPQAQELETTLCPCGRPGPRVYATLRRPPQSARLPQRARSLSA